MKAKPAPSQHVESTHQHSSRDRLWTLEDPKSQVGWQCQLVVMPWLDARPAHASISTALQSQGHYLYSKGVLFPQQGRTPCGNVEWKAVHLFFLLRSVLVIPYFPLDLLRRVPLLCRRPYSLARLHLLLHLKGQISRVVRTCNIFLVRYVLLF